MNLKPYQQDAFCKKPDRHLIFIFGNDKEEIEKKRKDIQNTLSKKSLQISIHLADDLLSKQDLFVSMISQDLFHQSYCFVFLRTQEKHLQIIKDLTKEKQNIANCGNFLLFEAQEIVFSSSLRKFCNNEESIAVLSCYRSSEDVQTAFLQEKNTTDFLMRSLLQGDFQGLEAYHLFEQELQLPVFYELFFSFSRMLDLKENTKNAHSSIRDTFFMQENPFDQEALQLILLWFSAADRNMRLQSKQAFLLFHELLFQICALAKEKKNNLILTSS